MSTLKKSANKAAQAGKADVEAAAARRPWTVIAWAAGAGAVAVLAIVVLVW